MRSTQQRNPSPNHFNNHLFTRKRHEGHAHSLSIHIERSFTTLCSPYCHTTLVVISCDPPILQAVSVLVPTANLLRLLHPILLNAILLNDLPSQQPPSQPCYD